MYLSIIFCVVRLLIVVLQHMVNRWFYITYASPSVKGDMFICIISNKDV